MVVVLPDAVCPYAIMHTLYLCSGLRNIQRQRRNLDDAIIKFAWLKKKKMTETTQRQAIYWTVLQTHNANDCQK